MQEKSYSVNGINIYSYLNSSLRSFCLSLYIRAGSIFETSSENGISHLFEHIVFRNIKRKYTNFYDELAFHGVTFQGKTYKEFIQFEISGPSLEFEFGAEVLCSIFDEIELTKLDLEKEKKRIKAEIREEDERSSVDYYFNRLVWKDTEVEKTVLGYCNVLDSVSIKKLNEYRKRCFSKDNFFVYITGNVSERSIDCLKNKAGKLVIFQSENKRTNTVSLNEDFFNRKVKANVSNGYWHYIKMGFDVDAKLSDGAVDILYSVLFNYDKALVHNYLSEDNPIIYSYDSTHEQYDNVGNIHFKFEVDKTKLEDAVKIIVDLLNDVKAGNFNFESSLKAEMYYKEMEFDDPSNLNWSGAYYNHILKANLGDPADKYHRRLDGVKKEDVIHVAKEIFQTRNMTVAIKGNKKKINAENIEKIMKKLDL